MTDSDFEFLRGFLKQRSGLAMTAEKRYLVESRLGPVCRRFNLGELRDLVAVLKLGRDSAAERAVVEAMTTNETFFFRDRTPFDLFRDVLLPQVIARNAARRRLRIWCAAASTGQEPYSLAMLLQEAAPRLAGWQVEIVATDLSTEVIERAKAGTYSHFEVQRGLPVQWLIKHFTQVGENWQISQSLRAMVDYRQLNLLNAFDGLGQFDVVYCRNVLIYFDAPTKADILNRIAACLAPEGALVLGAAETVIGLTDRLQPNPEHRGVYGHPSPGQRTSAPPFAAPLAAPAAMPVRPAAAPIPAPASALAPLRAVAGR
ncbi:chemotaxis protein methyltransferase [Methylobacterium gregans]|uniref:Chemotaxis protein methyltransferase n=1 Tax=Methylobacterium gregans TaxID=374424 RepID=A0AA37HTF7_9HYPH|nr:protein-glutamate O-methyltransferase CheR [Methylobacterium gregans]MDQ0522652.1 chemotaxis protein methyltransferase CheR [Methylobacterium gregans]GJD81335.1 Chemotaxis protein methyltransferase 1 [Methylobacterium gregans]GLS56830.1 chemotaxis protein methyltransferase [Methylobacterium gregans]